MRKRDINQGISILKEVIVKQPNFTLAFLSLHLGYTLLGTIGLIPASDAFTAGKPFLEKALELNPDLPECQLHLSYMCLLQDWDFQGAYKHLNNALEERPVVESYQSMASTLLAEGKFDAALTYIETALQLDPFSPINHHLKGCVFYYQEDYEKAVERFEKSIQLKSDFQVSTLYYGQVLIQLDRANESLTFFQNLPDDESGDIVKLGGMTLAYVALGETDHAASGINQLEALLDSEIMERAINLLILCRMLQGNTEEALALIEQGIKDRLPMMIYLFVDPILNPIRSEARFQKCIKKVFGD